MSLHIFLLDKVNFMSETTPELLPVDVVNNTPAKDGEQRVFTFLMSPENPTDSSDFTQADVTEGDLDENHVNVLYNSLVHLFNMMPVVVRDKFTGIMVEQTASEFNEAMKAYEELQEPESALIDPNTGQPFKSGLRIITGE